MKKTVLAYDEEIDGVDVRAYDENAAAACAIYVNGKPVTPNPARVTGATTLLAFLRDECNLKGAKLGCGEGGCGACSVIVSDWDAANGVAVHRAINGCLAPALSASGLAVTTVEGLGTAADPHPVQKRMADCHGSQCGFCTPGIVTAVAALVEGGKTTIKDVEEHLDGNLCRCTGYRPIWDAAKSLCADAAEQPTSCRGDAGHHCSDTGAACRAGATAVPALPFPAALKEARSLPFRLGDFWRPTSIEDACRIKAHFGGRARFIAGCSEVAIEQRFRGRFHEQYVSLSRVGALTRIDRDDAGGLLLGAAAPLTDVQRACERRGAEAGGAPFLAAAHMLRWFASTQIRNGACLGGNLATASPISDMNPLLAACRATLKLVSAAGRREVPAATFFLSYRTTRLEPDELIEAVALPAARPGEFVKCYKQSRRREDDIAIVTGTLRCLVDRGVVTEAAFAFGGLAATVKVCDRAARALVGQGADEAGFAACAAVLADECMLGAVAPGGQPAYRAALAASFLYKFSVHVRKELGLPVSPQDVSAVESFVDAPKPETGGVQTWPVLEKPARGLEAPAYSTLHKGRGPLVAGAPEKHATGLLQCTGEARYTDDVALPPGALHACLVLAKKAGNIKGVHTAEAVAAGGTIVGAEDLKKLPGAANDLGAIVHDEECFATEEARFPGQVVCVAVGETYEIAKRAAALVKVDIEATNPPASIDAAVAAGAFYEMTRHEVASAAWDPAALDAAEGAVVVTGEVRVGAQEHFYLECNTTVATPQDDGGLDVLTSTQAVMKTQASVAHICGVPMHKVVARCKRMGGGFGGKEARSVFASCACAVAAKVLKKPVRLSLERDVDMRTTGMRHAFVGRYTASVDAKTLKFKGLDVQLYSNGGASLDLSGPVMDRALLHCDNVYHWPALRARGVVCRTAIPPSTAFRGFGGPQGMVLTEHVVAHLAHALGHTDGGDALRLANLYAADGVTHFRQPIPAGGPWRVPRCCERVRETSEYDKRVKEVAAFNARHAHRKRGVALIPTKFGINFTAKLLNQGGALVHLYVDGTLLVSHGGTEMGQGLNTKVCQVVAQAFGVELSQVHVQETASDRVANSAATAASMSTDLYGMAALDACHQILQRLEPVYARRAAAKEPLDLASVAGDAFFNRIDLSAHGFHAVDTKRCGYAWDVPEPERGQPFNYWTQGAAVAEVEIDCLTGDFEIRRADVLVDLGCSVNPALDVGQIEGAFVQGAGWLTTEELVFAETGSDEAKHAWFKAPAGSLLTAGPGNYKLPAFNDVPRDLRVELLDRADNQFAVHSSKAVGEPPFFLGASVLFALQNAVAARRADFGLDDYLELRAPATPERIRMHCRDPISDAAVKALGVDPAAWQADGSY